jgi:hypothetical protein
VDCGLEESNDQLATHALVFMVVALNGSFKIPIAHFFTTSVSAKGKKMPFYRFVCNVSDKIKRRV